MKFDGETLCRLFDQLKNERSPLDTDWRETARFCLTKNYGGWQTDGLMTSTIAQQRYGITDARRTVYESKPIRAMRIFATVLERMMTPANIRWHGLTAGGKEGNKLMKIRRVAEYFDEVTRLMFEMRYHPRARFRAAQFQTYQQLGAFGTGPKMISSRNTKLVGNTPGLHYRGLNLRNTYLKTDAEGNLDTAIRYLPMQARTAKQMFGDRTPQEVQNNADKADQTGHLYEFIHVIAPRDDFDPFAIDSRSYRYGSAYVFVQRKEIVGEIGGYKTFPVVAGRLNSEPDSPYGYGPADEARASIQSANVIKKTALRVGQKQADPPLLAHDDGVISGGMSTVPGAVNYGGMSATGVKLVEPLQVGDFRLGKELLVEERAMVDSSFLVELFQILIDTPEMTATQVMDRIAEKAALIAPILGMLQAEDAGPMIEREINVIAELGRMPEMPPELQEARGEYEVEWTSPLALAQKSEEVAGFMRTVGWSADIVKLTGDPRPLRRFNFDNAIPDIARANGVPARWLNDDETTQSLADDDAEAKQIDQMATAAPAIAGVVKATQGAAMDKAA